MQALSASDDSIELKFNTIRRLTKNINDLIDTNIHMQKKELRLEKYKILILQPLLVMSQSLIIKLKV